MSLFSLSGCKTIYHKLVTGDHDREQYAVITGARLKAIQPGMTSREELREIFDRQECHQWTYRKPFWITWEGKRYRVDQALSYLQIIEFTPEELNGLNVYAWKEQRFVRVYLYKGVVQLYRVTHAVRESINKEVKGPLANYDPKLLDWKLMNGLRCDRLIYDVVSLGREPLDPEKFDRYCRPLIIEDE